MGVAIQGESPCRLCGSNRTHTVYLKYNIYTNEHELAVKNKPSDKVCNNCGAKITPPLDIIEKNLKKLKLWY
jgi:hypothetical protein